MEIFEFNFGLRKILGFFNTKLRFYPVSRSCKSAFTLAEVFYPVSRPCKSAFTLVEVLITIAIIGVVAAIIIPQKITQLHEKSTVKKLTQAYVILQQIDLKMRNENGNYNLWSDDSYTFFVNEFKKHVELADTCKNDYKKCRQFWATGVSNGAEVLYLKNGLIIIVSQRLPNNGGGHHCYGTLSGIHSRKEPLLIHYSACSYINVAVNGKNNTIEGKDIFQFRFMTDGVIPWGFVDKDSNDGFDQCYKTERKYGNLYCTAWVIYNQNMDYLHCRDKISWAGAHSCK